MSTMTLEQLLMKEPDSVLLDIYNELESRVVPATGYAHAYCRKVNKLIDAGEMCTVPDRYRKIYLPTLSKLIFKEMSRRWAQHCYNCKTVITQDYDDCSDIEDDVELVKCRWCDELYPRYELHITDLGSMCEHCITAIRSRGEQVTVFE